MLCPLLALLLHEALAQCAREGLLADSTDLAVDVLADVHRQLTVPGTVVPLGPVAEVAAQAKVVRTLALPFAMTLRAGYGISAPVAYPGPERAKVEVGAQPLPQALALAAAVASLVEGAELTLGPSAAGAALLATVPARAGRAVQALVHARPTADLGRYCEVLRRACEEGARACLGNLPQPLPADRAAAEARVATGEETREVVRERMFSTALPHLRPGGDGWRKVAQTMPPNSAAFQHRKRHIRVVASVECVHKLRHHLSITEQEDLAPLAPSNAACDFALACFGARQAYEEPVGIGVARHFFLDIQGANA